MLNSLNLSAQLNSTSKRQSNIELLRIIAMVMIVFSHCSVHDFFPGESSTIQVNNYILDWTVLGNLGVDIFLLISGYFLSTKIDPRKSAPKLWAQMWTYSIGCAALYLALGYSPSNFTLKSVLFPTVYNTYWFFSAYIIFLFLTPYINLMIRNSTQRQHFSCIIVTILFWSFFPAITSVELYGDIMPTFFMFYLIGSYFRKYPENIFLNKSFRILSAILSLSLMFLSSVIYRHWGSCLGMFSRPVLFFYSRNSILSLISTVSIFSIFIYLPVFQSTIINWIGSCTFGIYLFHDNPLIRCILWPDILPKYDYYNTKYLFLAFLVSVSLVMFVCILIETLRKIFVEKPFLNVVTFFLKKLPRLPDADI